jgi:membrane associated rhomboid family serine protease
VIPIGDSTRTRTFPVVMLLLVAANVAVFVYQLGLGPRVETFVQAMGLVPTEFLSGRDLPPEAPGPIAVTLITSMFIHGGFLHLGSNMLYLWIFGDNLEDLLGHLRFLIFYLASGIAAGLTHAYVNPLSDIPSVGASGAIAGVLGGYLVFFPSAAIRTLVFLGPFITITRISALIVIGIWFVTQLFSGLAALDAVTAQAAGVAFWAHIGGFVAGLVICLVLKPSIWGRTA